MKTLKTTILVSIVMLLLVSCTSRTNGITSRKDYDKYLEIKDNKSKDFAQSEIDFWQKKDDNAPNQTSYLSLLASNYSKLLRIREM
jgi:hypothetical protein